MFFLSSLLIKHTNGVEFVENYFNKYIIVVILAMNDQLRGSDIQRNDILVRYRVCLKSESMGCCIFCFKTPCSKRSCRSREKTYNADTLDIIQGPIDSDRQHVWAHSETVERTLTLASGVSGCVCVQISDGSVGGWVHRCECCLGVTKWEWGREK